MSHNIETIAWASTKPWHNLGVQVSNDLTPEEMMIASGTNWNVSKHPMFVRLNDKVSINVPNKSALLRDDTNTVLDVVGGDDWYYTQNSEAFQFFNEFVQRGDMTMETAGSLQNGKIVWVLAKVKESFEPVDGDVVESHLLFTNYHKYGFSRDIRFTPTRVVCNNTLTMALNSTANRLFKASHRIQINDEMVKETLGIAHASMYEYKERAEFLTSKRYDDESLQNFINNVFPTLSVKKEEKVKVSKNAKLVMSAIEHQPGVEFAPGSWWQALNSVTYVTDHLLGRTDDTRVYNMWYGTTKDLKTKAYNLALDFASKS
jgi:phage/plasmid-like protein (TIGR03299 family)